MTECKDEESMTDPTTQAGRFTNRLITEASPYLRQHAENPVEWYPWGEEALSRAKAEDKPILLSIGYSAATGAMSWHMNLSKISRLPGA